MKIDAYSENPKRKYVILNMPKAHMVNLFKQNIGKELYLTHLIQQKLMTSNVIYVHLVNLV